MPRAWYAFVGTAAEYDLLSKYQLITTGEPSCSSSNKICAVYAIGDRISGVQSFNPTDISFARTFFGNATANGVNQPPSPAGGNNAQGKPYYVRVKP